MLGDCEKDTSLFSSYNNFSLYLHGNNIYLGLFYYNTPQFEESSERIS